MSDLWQIGEDSGWTTLLDYEYDNFYLDDYGADILNQQCKQFQENLKTACEEKSHTFMADDTLFCGTEVLLLRLFCMGEKMNLNHFSNT